MGLVSLIADVHWAADQWVQCARMQIATHASRAWRAQCTRAPGMLPIFMHHGCCVFIVSLMQKVDFTKFRRMHP